MDLRARRSNARLTIRDGSTAGCRSAASPAAADRLSAVMLRGWPVASLRVWAIVRTVDRRVVGCRLQLCFEEFGRRPAHRPVRRRSIAADGRQLHFAVEMVRSKRLICRGVPVSALHEACAAGGVAHTSSGIGAALRNSKGKRGTVAPINMHDRWRDVWLVRVPPIGTLPQRQEMSQWPSIRTCPS